MLFALILFLAYYLPFQVALNPVAGVDLASVRVLILIIFFGWLAKGLKEKKIVIKADYQMVCVLIFLFLNGFSLFFAQNIIWGGRKMLFLLSIFPIYFVVVNVVNTIRKKEKIFKVLVISGSVVAALGILQFMAQFIFGINRLYFIWAKVAKPFLGDTFSQSVAAYPSWLVNISGHTYFRAISIFPDPHMLAFFLGLLLPLAVALFFKEKKNEWLVSVGLIFLADILTFSRGGYLGLIGGAVVLFLIFQRKMAKKYKLAVIGGLILLILALVIPSPVTSRFFSSFNPGEGSNVGRLAMWRVAAENIKEHPIAGVGLGNFPLAVDPLANYREPIYAHNTYLDVAVEAGIPAVLAWIGIIFFSIAAYLKQKEKIYLGAATGLVIFAVHSVVETGLYSPVVLTLVLMLSALASKEEKNAQIS